MSSGLLFETSPRNCVIMYFASNRASNHTSWDTYTFDEILNINSQKRRICKFWKLRPRQALHECESLHLSFVPPLILPSPNWGARAEIPHSCAAASDNAVQKWGWGIPRSMHKSIAGLIFVWMWRQGNEHPKLLSPRPPLPLHSICNSPIFSQCISPLYLSGKQSYPPPDNYCYVTKLHHRHRLPRRLQTIPFP